MKYNLNFKFKSKLNFAENMLRKKDADLAITFKSENGLKDLIEDNNNIDDFRVIDLRVKNQIILND